MVNKRRPVFISNYPLIVGSFEVMDSTRQRIPFADLGSFHKKFRHCNLGGRE